MEVVGDLSLEELVEEARQGCDVPVAWVSAMDRDHQHFLASSAAGQRGDVTGMTILREQSQCQHTIASGKDRFHSKLRCGQNETFDYVPVPDLVMKGLLPMDPALGDTFRPTRSTPLRP